MSKLRRNSLLLIIAIILGASQTVRAQQDGMNTFSPYTLYGLGSMNTLGTANDKSMAGAGLAVKNEYFINGLNPAGWSAVPQQTFLFDFGVEGDNRYISDGTNTTSNNSFNLSSLGMQFPIAKRLGFGLLLNSYSSVGYRMSFNETDDYILSTIGTTVYDYSGNGGTTQLKAGFGWEPIKGLSIGAAALFYHSSINRLQSVTINPIIQPSTEFRSVQSSTNYEFTKINFEVGFIYSVKLGENKNSLNFAATFQPNANITQNVDDLDYTVGSITTDTVSYTEFTKALALPNKISAGIAYQNRKLTIAADYIEQNYDGAFDLDVNENINISLGKYRDARLGISYTPNRFDVRNMMRRWTYRAGIRYGTSYLVVNDNEIKDYALSLGVGIPMQRNAPTHLNVGIDVGQTGSISSTLIRENYVKLNIGVNFMVVNEWFIRHKFK